MAKDEDTSIDDILKSIREAIVEKEQQEYFKQFLPKEPAPKVEEPQEEIFELSKNMMVKREDIPYQLGVWSFDDVAKKIMKKYKIFFAKHTTVTEPEAETEDEIIINDNNRVSVKEVL